MRRIEQDPEEIREIEDALARQATPTHEQPTEEFDSRAVIAGLRRQLVLRDPPELGWDLVEVPPNIVLGQE